MDGYSFSSERANFRPTALAKLLPPSVPGPRFHIPRGREPIREGETMPSAYMLQHGWIFGYKNLPNGTRQVLDIRMSGDFVGLQGLFRPQADQTFQALTDVVVAEIDQRRLAAAMRQSSDLTDAVLAAFAWEQAIADQRLVNIGRRTAVARTAHFFLELGVLLSDGNSTISNRYNCPMSQSMLADTLSMTNIYMNKVLRGLRDERLLSFVGGSVDLHDIPRLTEVADFDHSYLAFRHMGTPLRAVASTSS